jgi:patatin-like phospholipase/acyl hydrolase
LTFKILSLDGGGYRGYLAAMMLCELQTAIDAQCQSRGLPSIALVQCFDLLIGTSTGSLIAAALALGNSCQQVANLFLVEGAKIFPSQSLADLFVKGATGPLFDGQQLDATLHSCLQQTRLGDLSSALAITAYDPWNNRPLLFRSYHSAHAKIRLFDACRASSAYPGGFPAHRLQDGPDTQVFFADLQRTHSYFSFDHSCDQRDGIPLIDGGITANNPASLAVVERLTNPFLTPRESDSVLVASFGTGQMPPEMNFAKAHGLSALQWSGNLGNPLLEMLFVGSSRLADDTCRALVGASNYYRFQPVLLSDQLDHPFVSKNSVVRVTSEEMGLFGSSAFQASGAVNGLFLRLCHDYFYDNGIPGDPDTPDQQLHRLASLLV